jgi:TIR domain
MRGFISYSHEDRKVCDELRKPLKQLCRLFSIDEFWMDDATPTGRCFRAGYQAEIDRASIHIIMISANSLWSNEIMDREIPHIVAKATRDNDLILPVIVEDCLWHHVVGTLTASPRDDKLSLKPIKAWRPMSQGINRTARQFEAAIASHFGLTPKPTFGWPSP